MGSCWSVCSLGWRKKVHPELSGRLSESDRPCCLCTNRHQRGWGHAVLLQTLHTIADELVKTLTPHTLVHTYCACAHKRFAEVGIYTMLCSMIKNNCSPAVCAQWCKVTRYCPTALFCMSWTGPCRPSQTHAKLHTHRHKHSHTHSQRHTNAVTKIKWKQHEHLHSYQHTNR